MKKNKKKVLKKKFVKIIEKKITERKALLLKKKSRVNFFLTKKVFVKKYLLNSMRRRNKTSIIEFFFLGTKYKYDGNMLINSLFGDVFGIGFTHQLRFLNFLKVSISFRLFRYTERMRFKIETLLRRLLVGYESEQVVENIFYEKYKLINYHTIRLKMGLPIRGQRTRSNAGSFKRKRRLLNKVAFKYGKKHKGKK